MGTSALRLSDVEALRHDEHEEAALWLTSCGSALGWSLR